MTLVCNVETVATAPTERIALKKRRCNRAKRTRTTLRPDSTYHASATRPAANDVSIATPPPAMPSAGNGPIPKISSGESGTRITVQPQMTSAGTSMLPVPRTALASAFMSHSKMLPANTTFE